MGPIAIFVVVAAVSLAAVAAVAKNETAPGTTNERMMSGVAGPKASADTPQRAAKSEQPSRSELKKAKIKPKPKLQDPN